jgi:sulfur-oxidizing protein SoxY
MNKQIKTGGDRMHLGRRLFIQGSLALAAVAAIPRVLLAMAWPEKAFASDAASAAMTELFGTDQTTVTDAITLGAPEIAENGAVVPISIETTLQNVQSVSIVVEKNPRPLAVSFEIPPATQADVACRIKMGETSQVMAVVKTDKGLFSATKEVKVTIGGCGG